MRRRLGTGPRVTKSQGSMHGAYSSGFQVQVFESSIQESTDSTKRQKSLTMKLPNSGLRFRLPPLIADEDSTNYSCVPTCAQATR